MAAALAQARTSGKAVVVDASTTSTQQVTANPDGTLQVTASLLPERVKRSTGWVPVDATLTRNGDGSFSPAASASTVAVSGGGSGPLVTMTDTSGNQVSLTLPFPLPTPKVSGSTALYTSVLPGVDLQVQVDGEGGFSDTLIVHDAQAAANPDLKHLALITHTRGLHLASSKDGGFAATRGDGSVAFRAGKPAMWDSSAPSANAHPASRTAAAPTSTTQSTAESPGASARVRPVGMAVHADQLSLVPDPTLLSGPGVSYPVFIDPSITPQQTGTSNNWDGLYSNSACSGNPTFDTANSWGGEGVGYLRRAFQDGCGYGLERALYSVQLPSLPSNAQTIQAQLDAWDTAASSNDCNQSNPVYVHTIGAGSSPTFDGSTDWITAPSDLIGYDVLPGSVLTGPNNTNGCSKHDAAVTIPAKFMNTLIGNGVSVWSIELQGNENETESSPAYNFVRFQINVSVSYKVDVPPDTPVNMYTYPNSNPSGTGCGGGAYGWINTSSSGVTLYSQLDTPMSGLSLIGRWNVWDLSETASGGGVVNLNVPNSPPQASGAYAQAKITPADGHTYRWDTWSDDTSSLGLASTAVINCHFMYDATPPTTPQITANDPSFPPVGAGLPNPVTYAGAGSTINLPVTASDPMPANTCTNASYPCKASGVDHFVYSFDAPPTNSSATAPLTGSKTDGSGNQTSASATVRAPVANWGVHTLYIKAVDKAGNLSQTPIAYTFSAPWNPATKVTPGDLTGDGVPDTVATTKTGDLDVIPGDTDPAQAAQSTLGAAGYTGPVRLSTAGSAPNGGSDSWNNYLIAHRGNLFNQQVDDLYALNIKVAPHVLYVAKNDLDPVDSGTQPQVAGFTLHRNVPISKPPCVTTPTPPPANRCGSGASYDATDWNQVTQIAAPGNVYGRTMGGTSAADIADLITVENGQLWLYEGITGGSLTNPILLGDGDWSNLKLITPGSVGGVQTLWARDNTSGNIYSFPLTIDSTAGLPPLLHAPNTSVTPLVNGVSASAGRQVCLADPAAILTDGTTLILYTCDNGAEQSFSLAADQTVRVLGKCLAPQGGGTTNDTYVDLYTCNGSAAQRWTTGPNGELVNVLSGKCLADPSALTANDTKQILYTCDNGAEQNWNNGSASALPTAPAATSILNLSPTTYPVLASPGDVNSPDGGPDGSPDLYAVDTNGQLIEYPGAAPSGGNATFANPVSLGTITNTAVDAWSLADGTGTSAQDSVGPLNATLNGQAAWATDVSTSNNRGTILNLNGTTGYAATSGPAVDTSQSFTVSAWVYLNALSTTNNSTFVSQSDAGETAANGFQLYYSSGAQVWAFDRHNDDTTSTSFSAAYGEKAVAGQWTHLVGVYDANTGLMSLYVNGHLSATHTYTGTAWNASGPVEIGRRLYQGSYGEYSNAEISDVHIYNTALPLADAVNTADTVSLTNIN